MDKLRICSFNVRGLAESKKRSTVFNFLKETRNDILYLQQTHSCPKYEKKWIKEWGGSIYYAHGGTSSKGVAIAIKKKTQHKIIEQINDPNGRYILLNIIIDEQNYILLNYYAPTKDKPKEQMEYFEQIKSLMCNYVDQPLILAGDFNTCLNPKIDKIGGKTEKQSDYAKQILNTMDELNLADIWRVRNSDTLHFTRRQNTKSGMVHSRLDFFFAVFTFRI